VGLSSFKQTNASNQQKQTKRLKKGSRQSFWVSYVSKPSKMGDAIKFPYNNKLGRTRSTMPKPVRVTIVNVGYRSTNYWVVSAGTSRLLVDIGWPGTMGKMRAYLRRMCVPLNEIRYALATHYHIDHAGLAQEFKQAGICPCAPTCSAGMETTELINLLGYEFEHLGLPDEDIDRAKEVYNVVTRVKEEIRARRPVLVWNAFTSEEWDVVCGFDEEKKQFLGYGSYRGNDGKLASEDENRMAKGLPVGAIIVGEKTGKFDARSAELSALREAVRHAHDRTETFPGKEGIRAYDGWVEKFRNSDSSRGSGDSYCYYIYRSTHRAASSFLREIAPDYGKAKEALLAAADSFEAEADALNSAEHLLRWDSPSLDAQRNAEPWPILVQARDHYAAAIAQIEKSLAVLK